MKVQSLIPGARDRLATMSDMAKLAEAAVCLGDGNTNLVVVCDNAGTICGVVSKTDIVSRIGHCRGSSCTEMVATVMTQKVVSCHPDDPLKDVWSLMKENELLHIPVVDQNRRPVGILYARDVLQALLGEVEHEETLLRDYVMGIGYR